MVSAAYDSFDDLWGRCRRESGRRAPYTASLDKQGRRALRNALHRRLGRPTGAFELTARAWCVVGRI